MLWMITKFVLCMLLAGVFGFIFGWILSSLIKNEKQQQKYDLLKDDFDKQKADLNQAYSDLELKDEEMEHLEKKYQQSQKELLIKNMDLEEYEKRGVSLKSPSDLELENNTLREEIEEYKYLENENSLLHNEIKSLEEEKDKLLQELQELENANQDGKLQNNQTANSLKDYIVQIDSKLLKKHLKKAKRNLKIMDQELNRQKSSKKSKKR